MKTTVVILVAAGAAAFLGACATPTTLDRGNGAIAHNTAAMAVPPGPDADNTYIPFDRERRARAIEAYREGTVPEPQLLRAGE